VALVAWGRHRPPVAPQTVLPRWQQLRRERGLHRLRRRSETPRTVAGGLAVVALAGFVAWYGAERGRAGQAWPAAISWPSAPQQTALRLADAFTRNWVGRPGADNETATPAAGTGAVLAVPPQTRTDRPAASPANFDDYLREEPYVPAVTPTPPAEGAVADGADVAPAPTETPAAGLS
jgi:hypothetical protein